MRTFSIATKEDSLTLVEKAKRIAAEKNATFEGDSTSGTFSGNGVEGEYEVEDGIVTVTITEKPFFLSWNNVESRVREFFE